MNTDRAVHLNWLSEQPSTSLGVTWGIPWPEGAMRRDESFVLTGAGEQPIPVQTWPTAYWPDGSVKWTAHAASIGKPGSGPYRLGKGESVVPEKR